MLITQRSVVRVHAGPLDLLPAIVYGAVAQLGERLICIQEVAGSIPVSSTKEVAILSDPSGLTPPKNYVL